MGIEAERMPREAQLAQWWLEGVYGNVATAQGQELQVLYAGRPSPGVGPDFQDALLVSQDGEYVRGDVEVHVRQRDWQSHGHHRDPRYNSVVLHLFLRGKEGDTWLEKGTRPQEIVLESLPSNRRAKRHAIAAPLETLRTLSTEQLGLMLDDMGDRRFLGKTSATVNHLRGGDAREVLYSGLMEALGYSGNREPMTLLARALPLSQLKDVIGPRPDRLILEALLLGSAGLLPHQRGLYHLGQESESRSRQLMGIWDDIGLSPTVAADGWNRSGLRPHNSPLRRLLGASYLLERYWNVGLLDGLLCAVSQGNPNEVENCVQVKGQGFWAHHLDFHRQVACAPSLVGRGRAQDMVVNVVLPFFLARAHLSGDVDLRQRSWALYRSLAPCQENEITREVTELLSTSKASRLVVNSARRQQGLIHLYDILRGRDRQS